MEKTNQSIKQDFATLPELAGFTFRRFNGPEDYAQMAEVIMSNRDDPDTIPTTPEEIAQHYANLRESDIKRDLLFVFNDATMVAYGRVSQRWEEDNQIWVYAWLNHVHRDWKGKGLEKVLANWFEAQAKAIHFHLYPDQPGTLSVAFPSRKQDELTLFGELGCQPCRYFDDMIHDLQHIPEIPLPKGLELRPVIPGQIRMIWEASTRAFQDHWGYVSPTEEDYQSFISNKQWFQPFLWQVAWDGNEIAGSIMNYINLHENEQKKRFRGYTETISVQRKWRGKGLAKAMLSRSLKLMKLLNMQEAALGVDSENPNHATKLYADLGFQTESQTIVLRKSLTK